MAENDEKTPKNAPDPVFFDSLPDEVSFLPPRMRLSREALEHLEGLEKRLSRVQRSMLTYGRQPPRALREEEEVLRANLAHFKRRKGID